MKVKIVHVGKEEAMTEYFVKIQGPRPDEYNINGDCFTREALKKAITTLNKRKNTKAYFGQDNSLMIETVVNIPQVQK